MKKILSILLFLISFSGFGQHHMFYALASQNVTPPVWYDFRYATYKQQFSILAQEATSQTIFFKADGTIMYVIGSTGDDINQYTLSTAWEINSASYSKVKELNTLGGTSEATPTGMYISPNGTYLYVIGVGSDYVKQFTFGTAWDVATLTYTRELLISGEELNSSGIFFKSDGTYMYTIGTSGDGVDYYSLSTAWDISSKTYVGTKSISSQSGLAREIWFKDDGTEMYLLDGDASDFRVHKYTMSTAWDIANLTVSASRDLYNTVVFTEGGPVGLFFSPTCNRMYVLGNGTDYVWQFNISNAWNLDYLAYEQSASFPTSTSSSYGISLSSDGTKLYSIITNAIDSICQFSLSTAYDISSLSYVNRKEIGGVGSLVGDMYISPNGTHVTYVKPSGTANHNTLSTAYDITTLTTPASNYDPTTQDNTMRGIFAKPDGLSFYLLSGSSSTTYVYPYTTTVAWDFSSANVTVGTSKRVDSGTFSGQSLSFHPEGTIMYVLDANGDNVDMWYLSTAWLVSSATKITSISVSSQTGVGVGLTFSSDGTKMYLSTTADVYQYSIQ